MAFSLMASLTCTYGSNHGISLLPMLISSPPMCIFGLLRNMLSSDAVATLEDHTMLFWLLALMTSLVYYMVLFYPIRNKNFGLGVVLFSIHGFLCFIFGIIILVWRDVH